MPRFLLAAAIALAAGAALADESAIVLKPGPGHDLVVNNCAACHSLDYIQMNSPFPDAKLWEAEVTKMIKAYGAPIEDADAKAITDYLIKNYGSPGS
jgi:sulfite dehydrogenase (cytochrome) subunit B